MQLSLPENMKGSCPHPALSPHIACRKAQLHVLPALVCKLAGKASQQPAAQSCLLFHHACQLLMHPAAHERQLQLLPYLMPPHLCMSP
eukprot:1156931-Pelagomonas_calceolata.AAC.4